MKERLGEIYRKDGTRTVLASILSIIIGLAVGGIEPMHQRHTLLSAEDNAYLTEQARYAIAQRPGLDELISAAQAQVALEVQ